MLITPINCGHADGGSQIETTSLSLPSIVDSYYKEGAYEDVGSVRILGSFPFLFIKD